MGDRLLLFQALGRDTGMALDAILVAPQSIRNVHIQVWDRWSMIANVFMSPDATNDGTCKHIGGGLCTRLK